MTRPFFFLVAMAACRSSPPLPAEPSAAVACPPRVAEIPDSHLFSVDDARFDGHAVVVRKSERQLLLYENRRLATVEGRPACWRVGLANGYRAGDKKREGDRRTPEGWFRTSDKPTSSFYGAIAVHYPAVDDAEEGLADGRIDEQTRDAIVRAVDAGEKPPQATALGGEILVHGGGGSTDWTLGCVAMDDAHIDQLRAALGPGTRANILILP